MAMADLRDIEPWYGWLHLYNHEIDPNSPFHDVQHSLFEYNRRIYTFEAHPQWDEIDSENLLLKILFANYDEGYAIIELLGEWNDLHYNDFRLMRQHCLDQLVRCGIDKYIFICENVFNAWLEQDDYYEEFVEEIEHGWMCMIRARENVLEDFRAYGIDSYFFWSPEFDAIRWRKLKPDQLFEFVNQHMGRFLLD